MDIDDQPTESQKKAESLKSFTTGPLSSSLSKLAGSSRGLPSDKDFHFYNNFGEFKNPLRKIADSSQLILGSIGNSWGREIEFDPKDFDEAYDWLVAVNDEVFERFDSSIDEFKRVREKEEETGVKISVDCEGGFQLVSGKKKKKGVSLVDKDLGLDSGTNSGVKVASRDKKTMGAKPKIPFHIPTIPRPQDEFKIVVNNANMPFEHVWLQRSDDGSRFIHPQEKFSASDFVDICVGDGEPVKPPPIESTSFKLVEEVKDLKALAATLRNVNEFAVDLEHNQYRSFQGLTCLMQISTRTEDFIVDTLKLRIHVGPYLREVFKDPAKKKIMHGADRDIVWLQRDFGIYICNMFDTGQASRVLKLERNSLEYLLLYFCGVTANKEYQNADWRLRPLPAEMIKYAREDTHYLLYIYDLLKVRLLSASAESEQSDDLLTEVYKRSYDLCMQLYEKELLTDNSYLYIYGLQGAELNAQQLAVVAGLCEWRDVVARAEDESTGYVLPNKTVIEIAKQMPVTASKLRNLVKSKHPYVERNYGSVVSIIKHSMQNSAAFEDVAEQLKEIRIEKASEESTVRVDVNETLALEAPATMGSVAVSSSIGLSTSMTDGLSANPPDNILSEKSLESGHALERIGKDSQSNNLIDNKISDLKGKCSINIGQTGEKNINSSVLDSGAVATVQVLKKPNRAFGAMLGKSSSKRKLDADKEKEESKLEQIKSSVNLPFLSFTGGSALFSQHVEEPAKVSETTHSEEAFSARATDSSLEDVILLEKDEDMDEPVAAEAKDEELDHKGDGNEEESTPETNEGEETRTLLDLSSSFQQCFKSINQSRKFKLPEKGNESDGEVLQLKPFDYETARQQVRFGENQKGGDEEEGGNGGRKKSNKQNKKKNSSGGQAQKSEESGDFEMGRRRGAFPATGNRSATFRG